MDERTVHPRSLKVKKSLTIRTRYATEGNVFLRKVWFTVIREQAKPDE
jgi:hypothetical protein